MNSRQLKILVFMPDNGGSGIEGTTADAINMARSFSMADVPSIFVFNGRAEILASSRKPVSMLEEWRCLHRVLSSVSTHFIAVDFLGNCPSSLGANESMCYILLMARRTFSIT